MAKHQFQTEVNQLLHLMIHSLYSNKEIFLRELISNSSDALDKLQYLCLTDDNLKSLQYEPKIEVKFDKDKKTLSITDSGIGMDEGDLVEHLGTIAKSGTKSFLQTLSGDAKKDSQLIGQFGVGFYSAFMVSEKIEVHSKKAGSDKAHIWKSTGDGEYEILDSAKSTHGTEVTLYLKDEEVEEFASYYRVENIIKKYSDHIPFPIYMEKDGKLEQVNKASALWRLSKNEIKEDEYKEFYKTISHDSDEPLLWMHNRAEGTLEYNTLFYVPKKAPFDMFRVDYQPGVKLYVKRVFITDDEKELMPTYLRFLRGIIDSEDLPLNVSREILQQNRILAQIKKTSVKKVLSELEKLANDKEKYKAFYAEYGRVIKEGLYTDYENREQLLELVRFKSTKSDELVSLKEYKERMQPEQKSIYYILGENADVLKFSPLIESFRAKDIEVLLLDDEVDSIIIPSITEYKETPLHSVNSTEIDKDFDNKIETGDEKKFESLLSDIKEALKDEVKDVRLSKRLAESPACIVIDESDPNFAMQKLMKQMGGAMMGGGKIPEVKPILEINPNHEIFTKLLLKNDNSKTVETAKLLLDQAKLLEGIKIDDIVGFAKRLNRALYESI